MALYSQPEHSLINKKRSFVEKSVQSTLRVTRSAHKSTTYQQQKSGKPATNQQQQQSRPCQRVDMKVNSSDLPFPGIGIIEPRQFNVYKCEGSCSNASLSTTHDHVQAAISPNQESCCVPLHFEKVSYLYYDDDLSIFINNTIDDLVVKQCGCEICNCKERSRG